MLNSPKIHQPMKSFKTLEVASVDFTVLEPTTDGRENVLVITDVPPVPGVRVMVRVRWKGLLPTCRYGPAGRNKIQDAWRATVEILGITYTVQPVEGVGPRPGCTDPCPSLESGVKSPIPEVQELKQGLIQTLIMSPGQFYTYHTFGQIWVLYFSGKL